MCNHQWSSSEIAIEPAPGLVFRYHNVSCQRCGRSGTINHKAYQQLLELQGSTRAPKHSCEDGCETDDRAMCRAGGRSLVEKKLPPENLCECDCHDLFDVL